MSQNNRIEHIDSLRGMAVLLMVMVHAAATWNPFEGAQSTILAYIISGLGGLAAPLFVTLFGWGIYRSKLTTQGRILQAIFLFIAQILVNISAPHLFNPLTPGILSLMAILTLISPLIKKLIKFQINSFTIIVLLTFTIQIFFSEIQGVGEWAERVDDSSTWIIISNLILTGTYPLFPWFLFAYFGAFISSHKTDLNQTLEPNKPVQFLIICGLLFCLSTFFYAQHSGALWAHPSADAYLNFFPANAPFIIAAFTGVSLLWIFIQRINSPTTNNAGKISLTIYLIHFIPLSLMYEFDTKYDWGLLWSSIIVISYTLIWIPIANIWNKLLPNLNLEYLLRKIRQQSK